MNNMNNFIVNYMIATCIVDEKLIKVINHNIIAMLSFIYNPINNDEKVIVVDVLNTNEVMIFKNMTEYTNLHNNQKADYFKGNYEDGINFIVNYFDKNAYIPIIDEKPLKTFNNVN